MQKPEPKMSFVHPNLWHSGNRTGPIDIVRQPSEASGCTKPWCRTRNPAVVQKPMEKRTWL